MKLGILAYASPTGLGYQTKEYVDNLDPIKVLAVNLSAHNGMPVHRDWYSSDKYETIWAEDIPTVQEVERFLEGLDVIFMAETPLTYYLLEAANRKGIKTANAMNFEFCDYFKHPDWPLPTALTMPTVWNIDIVRSLCNTKVMHLPVGISRFSPHREITELRTIMHVTGRPAVMDRNGTLSYLAAIERLGNKYRWQLFVQRPRDSRAREYFEPVRLKIEEIQSRFNLEVHYDTETVIEMFSMADLHVLPRRYGGLCLPMTDSLSVGMPAIMPKISPNDNRLPTEWLVDAKQIDTFRGHTEIPVYDCDVDNLVDKIEEFSNPEFMRKANSAARGITDTLLWDNLKKVYLECFSQL